MSAIPEWIETFGPRVRGRILVRRDWSLANGGSVDHDHCALCSQKIWDCADVTADGVSNGWVTVDGQEPTEWVCEECFGMFADHLEMQEAA